MKTIIMKNKIGILVISVFSIGFLGCAQKRPPIEAMTKANMAVKRAEQANAAQAAPLEMRIAREKLDQAEKDLYMKNYEGARRNAEQAAVNAELSEAKASLKNTKSKTVEAKESLNTIKTQINKNTQDQNTDTLNEGATK